MNKTVSVIIPTYNNSQLLPYAIHSALSQTYKEIVDIIICDDGSTEDIKSVVDSFEDDRLVYIRQENKGRGEARNTAIRHSKGALIYPLDSDDAMPRTLISDLVNCVRHDMQIISAVALYMDSELISPIGGQWPPALERFVDLKGLIVKDTLANGSMYSRKLFDLTGGYSKLKRGEDWEFWINCVSNGADVVNTNYHYYLRKHPGNKVDPVENRRTKIEMLQYINNKYC